MAPARRAEAQVRDQAAGVPRDHQVRHPQGFGVAARDRHGPRRGPGDAPSGRPAIRLHRISAALEEGQAEAVGGPRPVGGGAADRRAGARAHALRARRLLDPGGDAPGRRGGAHLPSQPAVDRRQARRQRQPLRPGHRQAQRQQRRGGASRCRRQGARRRVLRRRGAGRQGRTKALHRATEAAVHDLDAAAGVGPQAALRRAAHDARGPAALRERLHHLHAHGLDDPVDAGRGRRAR